MLSKAIVTLMMFWSLNGVTQENLNSQEMVEFHNGVELNGQLAVENTQLVNQYDIPIQLKGMSSHGLLWYPEFTNYRAVKTTGDYGANVFRLAMYTDDVIGYMKYPEQSQKMAYAGIENVLGADMYVVLDWHILKDNNPLLYKEEAEQFFSEVASRYSNEPGLIYEICNEPNGETTWADIKVYANRIIPVIRSHSPEAIIIVGTPKYSTAVLDVLDDPLDYGNIMYAYHYYTGTARDEYEFNIKQAMDNDIPIFISEWGIKPDSETGVMAYKTARAFVEFTETCGISWINWSMSNKDEVYSVIAPSSNKLSDWEWADLTDSGRFVFSAFRGAKYVKMPE